VRLALLGSVQDSVQGGRLCGELLLAVSGVVLVSRLHGCSAVPFLGVVNHLTASALGSEDVHGIYFDF
jgi:hypothetical protein